MGRKSRLKRERALEPALKADHETPPTAMSVPASQAVASPMAHDVSGVDEGVRRRRGPTRRPVGARVARVSVDDAIWTAFRELCGVTPASIRLGQLVAAEVERANSTAPESAALDALVAIRGHADRLEQLLSQRSPHGGPGTDGS